MNWALSISPIPATHAKTLYGIGDTEATKIPALPYLVIRLSSLWTWISRIYLSAAPLPKILPSHHPTNAPETLVIVTIAQIRKIVRGSPRASRNIGNVRASGGIGWITASVNERIPRPGNPKSSAHWTYESHASQNPLGNMLTNDRLSHCV